MYADSTPGYHTVPYKGTIFQGHVISLAVPSAREATRIGRLAPVSHLWLPQYLPWWQPQLSGEPAAGKALPASGLG